MYQIEAFKCPSICAQDTKVRNNFLEKGITELYVKAAHQLSRHQEAGCKRLDVSQASNTI